uniref:Uncharacterized protein n=1 Tax=Anguilla anguilla TaxID=7936 RepID=A0A0E9SU73_ANGAN
MLIWTEDPENRKRCGRKCMLLCLTAGPFLKASTVNFIPKHPFDCILLYSPK